MRAPRRATHAKYQPWPTTAYRTLKRWLCGWSACRESRHQWLGGIPLTSFPRLKPPAPGFKIGLPPDGGKPRKRRACQMGFLSASGRLSAEGRPSEMPSLAAHLRPKQGISRNGTSAVIAENRPQTTCISGFRKSAEEGGAFRLVMRV